MLRELHITNFAVIEDVRLELDSGLNCFTGQTGAGKSLILGAFEVLLGLKQGGDMMRPGAEEARVSGVFEINHKTLAQQISEIADQAIASGEQLLITRKLFASGRSSLSINGQPATQPMVRQVGELLVDIHGQHDHQYLLKPANQLSILDTFGRSDALRAEFAQVAGELRRLKQKQTQLETGATLRRQQLELYEFQADEIDALQLREGEFAELKATYGKLSNLKRIKAESGAAHGALYDAEGSVLERLQAVVHVLNDLAELDPKLVELAEQVRSATLSLQDAAFTLGSYAERLDMDGEELAGVEDRLNQLNRIVAKYSEPGERLGEDPVLAVLAYREQIEQQLQQLRADSEDQGQMHTRIAELQKQQATLGTKLSEQRKAAAKKLRPLIEAQLHELGMAGAQFEVAFEAVAEDDIGASGLDSVEMLVRTNPGQPARPLRKVASGGELSRIMLALKAILAQHDRVSVLVFDEIDANIGGRMGTVIGEKLRALADTSKAHQVLCITHLPQIAAYAHRHLRIAKSVSGKGKDKQTRTSVMLLDGDARVDELAEMLAGEKVSTTTRKQAKELLTAAG